MKNLKLKFIFVDDLLYTFSSIGICVILLIFTTNLNAEEDLQKALDLWENNSLLNESDQKQDNVNEYNLLKNIEKDNQDESKSSSKILQNDLDVSYYDTLGLYDDSNGGMEPNIWKNSNLNQIQYLMNLIPSYIPNVTLNNLINKSLLTISAPPKKIDDQMPSFFDLKIQYLYDTGNYADLKLFIKSIDSNELSDDLLKKIINLELMFGNFKSACRTSEKIDDQSDQIIMQAFCKAMSNNLPALDLLTSLLIEEENIDSELIDILNSYLNHKDFDVKNITDPNLLMLNLLSNKNVDYSNFINEESSLESKLFYVGSDLNINRKKMQLTEKLIFNNLLENSFLDDIYKKYLLVADISLLKDYSNEVSSLEKRVAVYNQIRNTSNQEKLLKLVDLFVDEMASKGLLMNVAELVYDKVKVITPKKEFKEHAPSACLVLIINNDLNRCKEWRNVIGGNSNSENILNKVDFYLSLNEPDSEKSFYYSKDFKDILLDNTIANEHKNLLAKFFMIRQSNNMLSYWSSTDGLVGEKIAAINIKPIEYLNQIPENKIGESILMILFIYSYDPQYTLDQFSLFAIIEALERIDKEYTNQFLFEYFVNNSL